MTSKPMTPEEWAAMGRELRKLDPEKFDQCLEILRALVEAAKGAKAKGGAA